VYSFAYLPDNANTTVNSLEDTVRRISIVVFIMVCILLMAGVVSAQDGDIPPELDEHLALLEEATISIRGLEGVSIERDFPSREELIAYVNELLDAELPPEEAARSRDFYLALGLIDPAVDLRAAYAELLGSQIAGFYDTETGVMNVIPIGGGELEDELSATEQIIYVHEFTHALQDQFFQLEDTIYGDETLFDSPDRSLAAVSLVEGDATLVMNIYTQRLVENNPLAALQVLSEGLTSGGFILPEGTPDILIRELMFPYQSGATFVTTLYADGEWAAVDAAYANLPASAEQILHPDKYLNGEQPIEVTLAESESALGDGWAQAWDGALGEWYLREYLRTHVERAEANPAAAGWGGDNFHIYSNAATDERALIVLVEWDTQTDADEFVAAYETYGTLRFGGVAAAGCWSDDDAAVCLVADGTSTLIVDSPSMEQTGALIAAQE
jgi:hypothetical protein